MTEELRGLLREELSAERPPPLGDLVGTVLREGRRIRRRRRLAAAGAGTALAGVVAVALAVGAPFGTAVPPPPAGGLPAAAPVAAAPVAVSPVEAPAPRRAPASLPAGAPRSTRVPTAPGVAASPEVLLVLLRELLPAGRTSHYAKAGDRDPRVQLYLDRGDGPGMVRLSVSGYPRPAPTGPDLTGPDLTGPDLTGPDLTGPDLTGPDLTGPDLTGEVPTVTVDDRPGDCVRSRIVRARWPDGLTVEAALSTCLVWAGRQAGPSPLVLTDGEAAAVVADPRWATAVDPALVAAAAKQFPRLALFG